MRRVEVDGARHVTEAPNVPGPHPASTTTAVSESSTWSSTQARAARTAGQASVASIIATNSRSSPVSTAAKSVTGRGYGAGARRR